MYLTQKRKQDEGTSRLCLSNVQSHSSLWREGREGREASAAWVETTEKEGLHVPINSLEYVLLRSIRVELCKRISETKVVWARFQSSCFYQGLNYHTTSKSLLLPRSHTAPCTNSRPVSGGKDIMQLWVRAGLNKCSCTVEISNKKGSAPEAVASTKLHLENEQYEIAL